MVAGRKVRAYGDAGGAGEDAGASEEVGARDEAAAWQAG